MSDSFIPNAKSSYLLKWIPIYSVFNHVKVEQLILLPSTKITYNYLDHGLFFLLLKGFASEIISSIYINIISFYCLFSGNIQICNTYCLKNKNLTITIWLWLAYPVTFHFFHKAVLINVEEFAATGRVSKVTCLPIGSFMSTIKRVVIRMSVWAHNLFWTSDALHMQLHAQSCNTVYKILLQITQLLK